MPSLTDADWRRMIGDRFAAQRDLYREDREAERPQSKECRQGMGGEMNVAWVGTSPETGRYSPVETRAGLAEFRDFFQKLRARGEGYVEVRREDAAFPRLALAFRDERAVVHRFDNDETCNLLYGDGVIPAGSEVVVPVIDDDSSLFTAEFVSGLDRAWGIVCEFAETGNSDNSGEWEEL